MKLYEKIRIIRKARGFSQEGLGYSLSRVCEDGISRQSISDWENGKTEPRLDNIRDLAKVLNVSFDALLDEDIDLNDPQVLSYVLSNEDLKQNKEIQNKFDYPLYCNNLSWKSFRMCMISGLFIFIGSVLLLLTLIENLTEIYYLLMYTAGGTAIVLGLMYFLIAGIKEIKAAIKGEIRVTHLFGHLTNNFLNINTTQNADNTLFIPIEKIKDIKLGEKQKRNYGEVLIYVEGRERPITIIDLMKPQKFIEIFNKISDYKNDEDVIKIF